jgi:hypothetical protein
VKTQWLWKVSLDVRKHLPLTAQPTVRYHAKGDGGSERKLRRGPVGRSLMQELTASAKGRKVPPVKFRGHWRDYCRDPSRSLAVLLPPAAAMHDQDCAVI